MYHLILSSEIAQRVMAMLLLGHPDLRDRLLSSSQTPLVMAENSRDFLAIFSAISSSLYRKRLSSPAGKLS